MKKNLIALTIIITIFCVAIIFAACEEDSSISHISIINYKNEQGEEIVLEMEGFDETKLPTFQKTGYTFKGWNIKKSETEIIPLTQDSFLIFANSKESINLVPELEKNIYKITYTGVENETNNNISSYTIEDGTILLKEPSHSEDVDFLGWYLGEEQINSINVSLASDLTIDAKWRNKCVVTIKGVCGESLLFEETTMKSKGDNYSYTAPEILGYLFDFYSTGETDSTISIITEDNVTLTLSYEIAKREMPIVIINTEDAVMPYDKETYILSNVSIINTKEDNILEKKAAGVRLRGNSSLSFDKKSFRIKFDKKQSVLGSSYKAKSWTLIANYSDRSLLRNYIAYELADAFEDIAFSSTHIPVELYFNGEYMGVYLLCDQMQAGSGRIDIDESYINEDGVSDSGDIGYFLEMDARAESEGELNKDYIVVQGNSYVIKTPDTSDEKYNKDVACGYIEAYLTNCLSTIMGKDYSAIKTLINVESFADTYIIQELFSNTDVGFSSFYLYKDKGGELFAGPVWDFDISAGLTNYVSENGTISLSPNKELYASRVNRWYELLLNVPEFKQLVSEKLYYYKSTILKTINRLDVSDNNGVYLLNHDALTLNFERWPIMGKSIWPNPAVPTSITSIEGQIEYLRLWLLSRYYYMVDCYA
ncbi:MAG: hypothetical protein E7338_02805 [Clostridiales bacterium]|nr:hypothetical protein [Clostridiales bacterium]